MSERETSEGGAAVTHGFLVAATSEALSSQAIQQRLEAALASEGIIEGDVEYLGEIELYSDGDMKES